MSISNRKTKYFSVVAAFVLFLYFTYQIVSENKALQIIFLDVGQGDSILIQKGTRQILIDGGPSGKTELAKLGKHLTYFDREIEIVVATHPDKDHIGGLIDVARNYKIGKVLATGAEKDTAVFKEWKDVLLYNKIETLEVWRGTEVKFDGIRMKIIAPAGKIDPSAGDVNGKSIVARMDCDGNSFLFTGDVENPAERDIVKSGENIDVDILKIAHHGSKYSSSEEFLEAASPKVAVISVGANNSYGHPAEAVLEALKKRDVEILRTDEAGNIVYNCNSEKCKYQNEK